MEGGQGGRWGGGTTKQCGSNKRCTGSPFLGSLQKRVGGWGDRERCGSKKTCTGSQVDGGGRGEVAHGGRARGEMGGGTREQCGSNKIVHCSPFWAPFSTFQLV